MDLPTTNMGRAALRMAVLIANQPSGVGYTGPHPRPDVSRATHRTTRKWGIA